MNRIRLLAFLATALLPMALAGCGNKGPLVQAAPIPPTIDGTPTIEAGDETPTEGTEPPEEAVGDTVEDTDPSDEIALPDETLPTEDEPVPEPAPEPVPPAGDPNG
jgi:predicted small lipoprotein YifL